MKRTVLKIPVSTGRFKRIEPDYFPGNKRPKDQPDDLGGLWKWLRT